MHGEGKERELKSLRGENSLRGGFEERMMGNRGLRKIRSPLDLYNDDSYSGQGDENKE